MHRVLLLGANGLLGSHLSENIQEKGIFELISTSRKKSSNVQFHYRSRELGRLFRQYRPDIVINCIALTSNESSVLSLFKVNGILPLHLAVLAYKNKMRLVHISSNAVFSGASDVNSEYSLPLPCTKYGISKLIGDLAMFGSLVIRTSFVGASRSSHSRSGLLDELKNLPQNSVFHVQDNFTWNGITAEALSEFICTAITQENFPVGLIHVGTVEKIDRIQLVEILLSKLGRTDVSVVTSHCQRIRNMSLDSSKCDFISKIWSNSRYGTTPTILQLIQEIQGFN